MRPLAPLTLLCLAACTAPELARKEPFSLPGGFARARAVAEPVSPSTPERARLMSTGRLVPGPLEVDLRGLAWPVDPVVVSSPWGDRVHPIKGEPQFHGGIDLAAQEAQAVFAAQDGVVRFAGWNGGYGNEVELEHDAVTETRYGHLLEIGVACGERVRRGQVLGLAGQTGQATGPHVHFEVRRRGESVDPEAYLPTPRPVLLSGATR